MQQLAFIPPAASPVRRQYLTLKQQHPGAILFFQLGDFFETFEDDARLVAEVCDVALTSREMGRGERLPMAGVPVHAAETYVGRLVERGYHIAICQQMEDPAAASARGGASIVRREVTRVITPGTLVDPALLSAARSNYLAALVVENRGVGIAYADVSTGEFACAQIDGAEAPALARAELWRIQASEHLLATDDAGGELLPTGASITADRALFGAADVERALSEHFRVATTAALGLAERPLAARAAAAILRYVQRTQSRAGVAIEQIRVYDVAGHMVLDPATRDHLEIARGARGRRDGSLLHCLDRTSTSMGARLLARWLGHPLLDRMSIEARLDSVQALVEQGRTRQELQALLARLPDLERLAGRAAQRIITPREALALAEGIETAAEVCGALTRAEPPLCDFASRVIAMPGIAAEIRATLVDDPPLGFGEGLIRIGREPELDELRSSSSSGRQLLVVLERRERERTGIKNLKVGYNRVFGYYLEAPISTLSQALDYYRQQESGAATVGELLDRLGYQRRQTLASVERFTTGELRDHEAQQARSTVRMAELERAAYEALVTSIAEVAPTLQATAAAVAELDVLAAFAQLAQERRYVRPEIVEAAVTEITGGRHPVVEAALGWDAFIPNDARLETWSAHENEMPADGRLGPQVALLTGPNMAGKTTYGRMVLMVCLMAQCGSFVPAERARLGLVDRIFLRSGAGDDIAGGQSTFMVEMTETAAILRAITPRSLAFFDEVGRGTSTYDGMAIARAIVEYLVRSSNGCRMIFSTHYHELADIAATWPAVTNFRMDVRETASQVAFTYRVLPGSADRSYGVHVARLAGLPAAVLARAAALLAELESGAQRQAATSGVAVQPAPAVVYDLAEVDVEHTTPIEALALLERLRAEARLALGAPADDPARPVTPPGG